jgi:hypothetical protein
METVPRDSLHEGSVRNCFQVKEFGQYFANRRLELMLKQTALITQKKIKENI